MDYNGSVMKRVALFLIVAGAAVAMVACQGAVGKTGEPGPQGKPGDPAPPAPPVNLAPIVTKTIEDVTVRESGIPAAPINLVDHFVDPEGKPLTFVYSVDPPDAEDAYFTVDLSDGFLTVTPSNDDGDADITVTATDGDKSVSTDFSVTVEDKGTPIYRVGIITGATLKPGDQHEITRVELDTAFEGENLRYRAETEDTTIVQVVQADDDTITITALRDEGAATVTITATDEDGEEAISDPPIEIIVVGSFAPQAGDQPDPVTLTAGDEPATVNASDHFLNPAGVDLEYMAESSNDDVATAEEADGVVTITPVAEGMAEVTITATNPDGEAANQTITVTVNAAPVVVQPVEWKREIPDVTFEHDGPPKTFVLADYFNYATMYVTDHGDGTIVTAEVNDEQTMLTLTRVGPGTETVEVTPSNSVGVGVAQSITVTVKSPAAELAPPTLKPNKEITSPIRVVQLADSDAGTAAIEVLDAAEKDYDLADLIRDPAGPDDDLVFSTTTTDPKTVAVYQSVVDTDEDGSTLDERQAVSATTLDKMTTGASHITIRGRKAGKETVTITATGDSGASETWKIEVTVGGANSPPAVGTASAIPDQIGAVGAADNKRLKIDESRTILDGVTFTDYFTDSDVSTVGSGDTLTLSVKYYTSAATVTDGVIADGAIEVDPADAGVSYRLTGETWAGDPNAKFTLTLIGERGTDNSSSTATDHGHMVALIATDSYGMSRARLFRVIVNNSPMAYGAQADEDDRKTLSDSTEYQDLIVPANAGTNAQAVTATVTLVQASSNTEAEEGGHFSDGDGAEDLADGTVGSGAGCVIKSTGGTDEVATFTITEASAGNSALEIKALKVGTKTVTISCTDTFGVESPSDTLTVKVTGSLTGSQQ